MAAPIYRGGRPFIKPGIRTGNDTGIFNTSGAPVDGTSGTLVGVAGPGSILMRTNGTIYVNTNTKASPTWTALGQAGAAAITSGTITGATISANIESDTKVLAASAAFTSNATLTTLTGFSWSVVAGATYAFEINLPATMTTNGGIAVAFKLTTATLTSIRYSTYVSTATDNGTAVSTTGTTTTDQTKMVDTVVAAYTHVRLYGSFVVGTAGTFAFQAAQSASHADTTTVLIGSTARVTRAL